MGTETRTTNITFKTTPTLKAQAKQNAAQDGRTLSNYIEKLINDDTARRLSKQTR